MTCCKLSCFFINLFRFFKNVYGRDSISKELENRLLILETQVQQLKEMVLSLASGREPVTSREVDDQTQVYDAMRGLTVQRHATIQMVLDGATQAEMAERFQISEEAVKGRLYAIRKILGQELGFNVTNTSTAMKKFREVIDTMSDEKYLRVAGLPKDWHKNWTEEDREENPKLYKK